MAVVWLLDGATTSLSPTITIVIEHNLIILYPTKGKVVALLLIHVHDDVALLPSTTHSVPGSGSILGLP